MHRPYFRTTSCETDPEMATCYCQSKFLEDAITTGRSATAQREARELSLKNTVFQNIVEQYSVGEWNPRKLSDSLTSCLKAFYQHLEWKASGLLPETNHGVDYQTLLQQRNKMVASMDKELRDVDISGAYGKTLIEVKQELTSGYMERAMRTQNGAQAAEMMMLGAFKYVYRMPDFMNSASMTTNHAQMQNNSDVQQTVQAYAKSMQEIEKMLEEVRLQIQTHDTEIKSEQKQVDQLISNIAANTSQFTTLTQNISSIQTRTQSIKYTSKSISVSEVR